MIFGDISAYIQNLLKNGGLPGMKQQPEQPPLQFGAPPQMQNGQFIVQPGQQSPTQQTSNIPLPKVKNNDLLSKIMSAFQGMGGMGGMGGM